MLCAQTNRLRARQPQSDALDFENIVQQAARDSRFDYDAGGHIDLSAIERNVNILNKVAPSKVNLPPQIVYPPQILYPPKYYTPLGLISVLPNSIPPFHHIQANETRTDSGHGLNTTAQ